MRSKNFCKKLIAGVSAVALMFSVASYMPRGIFSSLDNSVTAAGEGSTAVYPGSGGGVVGDTANYGDVTYDSGGSTGVRIYLSSNRIYKNDNKKITLGSLAYLDTYKEYALYEFSGDYGTSIYGNKCTAYGWASNGGRFVIPRHLILGSAGSLDANEHVVLGSDKDKKFSFSSVLKNSKATSHWSFLDDSGVESVSDWSNATFGEDFDYNDLEDFLTKYAKCFTDAGKSYPACLPKTSAEFVQGNWSIVVEPLMMLRLNIDAWESSAKYAISYNDFYRYQDSNKVSVRNYVDIGENSFANKVESVGWQGDVIAKDFINGCLQKLYVDFDSAVLNGAHITTKGEANKKLRGFGVFAQNAKIYLTNIDLDVNRNITLKSSKLGTSGNTTVSAYYSQKGQTVLSKSIDSQISAISKISYANLKTSWDANSVKSIPFLTWNTTYESITTKKENKADNKETVFKRLTGFKNVDNDYIMVESYVGLYTNSIANQKLENLYTGTSANIEATTVDIGLQGLSENIKYYYGTSFSAKPVVNKSKSDLSVVANSLVSGYSSGSDIITALSHKNVLNLSSSIKNVIGNSCTALLDKSAMTANKNTNLYNVTSEPNAKAGVSLQLLVPNQKVATYYQTISRDAEGNVKLGAASPSKSQDYSIYGGSAMSHFYGAADNTAVYYVVFPNAAANSTYSLTGDKTGIALAKKIFTPVSENAGSTYVSAVPSYNTSRGITSLQGVVNANIVKKDASCVLPVGTEQSAIAVGAYADTSQFVGYSVYRIEDAYVTQPQAATMTLEPYRLNYVFPTLLGESEGYFVKTVSPVVLDTFKITKTSNYSGFLIGSEIATRGSRFGLINLTKLPNGKTILFDNEATDPKEFTGIKKCVTLNHAVNLNRGVFGDKYTVSSLHSSTSTFGADNIQKVLSLTVGNTGSTSPSSISTGTTSLFDSQKDKFRWACDRTATLTYGSTGISYEVSPFEDGSSKSNAGYDITENVFRYVTVDKSTTSNTTAILSAGKTKATEGDGYKYSLYSVEAFNDSTLKFYPEVAMEAYKYDATSPSINSFSSVTKYKLYVMGEKVRSLKPSGMYGIAVKGVSGNNIVGKFKSDTVATGSDAKKLSEKYGNLPVVYAGGNINLSAAGNFTIDLSGFMLDQIDKTIDTNIIGKNGTTSYNNIVADGSDLKSAWGNTSNGYDSKAKYEAWLKEIKGSLAVDVSLQTKNGSNVVKTYKGFKTSTGKLNGGEIESITSFALTIENGSIKNDKAYQELIKAIKTQSGVSSDSEAEAIFKASGIGKTILDAIESSTNGKSDKATGFSGDHWYDETVRTFVVRYYKCTPLQITNVAVSDKIDINAGPSQDKNTHTLFQNGYVGQWNMTVYLSKAVTSLPGIEIYVPKKDNLSTAIDAGSVLIANKHIEGADFIISDATTADARN